MASAKQIVLGVLESLPDDCSLHDVAYQLNVRRGVEEGGGDTDERRFEDHYAVMRQARKYLEG